MPDNRKSINLTQVLVPLAVAVLGFVILVTGQIDLRSSLASMLLAMGISALITRFLSMRNSRHGRLSAERTMGSSDQHIS